jgi:hypothetical protein
MVVSKAKKAYMIQSLQSIDPYGEVEGKAPARLAELLYRGGLVQIASRLEPLLDLVHCHPVPTR